MALLALVTFPTWMSLVVARKLKQIRLDRKHQLESLSSFSHCSEPCPAQEKEMTQFIQSVLGKTSKLHVLVGELQSKYDDPRAA